MYIQCGWHDLEDGVALGVDVALRDLEPRHRLLLTVYIYIYIYIYIYAYMHICMHVYI